MAPCEAESDDQFMQGKAKMDGRIRSQMRIDPVDRHRHPCIGPIGGELLLSEFEQIRATPARIGDQVLRVRQRLQAATEFDQEIVKRQRVAGRLRGDALDDSQKVFGAVRQLAQERFQYFFRGDGSR